jgi:hypothetical protein
VHWLSGECLMQTPYHVSLDRFVAEKALFLTTACLAYGDETVHCLRCGSRIKWEEAFISTHCAAEECIGTGKISQIDIPYCPQCEEIPYTRGCFHPPPPHPISATSPVRTSLAIAKVAAR